MSPQAAFVSPFWRIEAGVAEDGSCLKIVKITDFWVWIEGFPGGPFWRRLDSIRTPLNWRIKNRAGSTPVSFPDNLGSCDQFITITDAGRSIFFNGDHYIEVDDPGLKTTVTEWWNENENLNKIVSLSEELQSIGGELSIESIREQYKSIPVRIQIPGQTCTINLDLIDIIAWQNPNYVKLNQIIFGEQNISDTRIIAGVQKAIDEKLSEIFQSWLKVPRESVQRTLYFGNAVSPGDQEVEEWAECEVQTSYLMSGRNIYLEVEYQSETNNLGGKALTYPLFYYPQLIKSGQQLAVAVHERALDPRRRIADLKISGAVLNSSYYELELPSLYTLILNQDQDFLTNIVRPYMEFLAGAVPIGDSSNLLNKGGVHSFDSGSQTFYIGKDPDLGNSLFQGAIRRVYFDPNASNPGVA